VNDLAASFFGDDIQRTGDFLHVMTCHDHGFLVGTLEFQHFCARNPLVCLGMGIMCPDGTPANVPSGLVDPATPTAQRPSMSLGQPTLPWEPERLSGHRARTTRKEP
jgi:hypothetical protein